MVLHIIHAVYGFAFIGISVVDLFSNLRDLSEVGNGEKNAAWWMGFGLSKYLSSAEIQS